MPPTLFGIADSEKTEGANMAGANESCQRYEQLKASMRTLRSQIHSSRPPSCEISTCHLTSQSPTAALGFLPCSSAKLQTANSELAQIQFQIEQQERQEEIGRLQLSVKGKAQQIENMQREHAKQRKKLESRIQLYADKACSLEAQLSNRIAINQQELQAQAYTFAAKTQKCKDDTHAHEEALIAQYEATIASIQDQHHFNQNQVQMLEKDTRRRVELAEATIKLLEEKLNVMEGQLEASMQHANEAQELLQQKEREWNFKMNQLSTLQDCQLKAIQKELAKEKADREREKEDTKQQHDFELQRYKLQKVKEMDCIAERVKAAVESKEASITQLKTELARQQQQASDLLDLT